MGLDQYVNKLPRALEVAVDFEIPDDAEPLFYWRKHPNLHGWFEALYRSKGGKDEFNVVPVQITVADLDRLEADVLGDQLPATTGFFFGTSQPEDKLEDIEFITKARTALAEGNALFYYAWW